MGDRVHGWRKLAGVTWGSPKDPQFYGELDVDATELLAHVDRLRARSDTRVTITHLIGKAVAHGLREVPQFAVRLTGGHARPRTSLDIFFIIAAGAQAELNGVKVEHVDRKSTVDVAREVARRAEGIERGADTAFDRGKTLLAKLPRPVLRTALRGAAWLTSDLNLDLSRFGMPRQAFGSAMVTSVGMWGVARGFSPLASYYRVPLLVLVGAVTDRPVVRDGAVTVRPVLTLTATVDHRYADGSHAARLADAVRRYCADPAAFEPLENVTG